MQHALIAAVAAVSMMLTAVPAFSAEPDVACPSNRVPPLALPRVKEALANNREVTVVALGSSSTQGSHASDVAHSYPAVLQSMLSAALPNAHLAVLNRGVGGQDVTEMLPRIERDVLSVRPTLVIWQVGANVAMRRMAPELFKRLLTAGVQRLREARIDVILMDNQRAPAILASPDHIRIDQAMADVAAGAGAGLFGRGALMDQWRVSGYPYERFVADDGIHHNDLGYRCVARALAASILEGLGHLTPSAEQAVAARR